MALSSGYLPKPDGAPYVDGSETIQDMQDSAIQESDFETQQGLSKHRTDALQHIASMAGSGFGHSTAIEITKSFAYVGYNAAAASFNFSLKLRTIGNYNIGDKVVIKSDEGLYGAYVWVESGVSVVDGIELGYDSINPAIVSVVGSSGGNAYAIVPQVGQVTLTKLDATTWVAEQTRTENTDEVTSGHWRSQGMTAHGFSRYNAVYQVNHNTWALAIANDWVKCRNIWIVCGQFTADAFTAVKQGNIYGQSPADDGTFTQGQQYYLSDTTPGLITTTKPTAHGSFVKPIFIAASQYGGFFQDVVPRAVQKDRIHILHNITGLTGGGATNLDGLTSADWDDGTIVTVYITGKGKQEWQWNTGADAENGLTIVQADDGGGNRYLARVA